MPIRKFVLNENQQPVECDDVVEWARWFTLNNRHVAGTSIGPVRVSTIFKGMDLSGTDQPGPPLFETMVFGGVHNGRLAYASTWEAAVAMHARIVREVVAVASVSGRRVEDHA